MITHSPHRTSELSNFMARLSCFPSSKIVPALLFIIQSARDGVVIVDALQRIVLVNSTAERVFGYEAEELLEKPLEVLIPEPVCSSRMEHLGAHTKQGRKIKREVHGMHSNGKHIRLQANISHLTVQSEPVTAIVFQEAVNEADAGKIPPDFEGYISREIAVSSQKASEIEKRRFSRKLYDDIGQDLGVLKLDLDWLESTMRDAEQPFAARISRMQCLLDQVIRATKSVASALRPPLLDDFGLLPAVEWMAESFRKKTAIRCKVESYGMDTKLDDTLESALFRVVQEGLSNIERHSHAGNAEIVFIHTGVQLDVMIRDDGIGMPSDSENKPGCYGLGAMQERIFVLGGKISIRNIRPHGVAIHVSIPVESTIFTEPFSQPPIRSL